MDQEPVNVFPFSAVLNADDAKNAIACLLTSPNIHSLLIQGTSGSAKTTLVRSIPSISDLKIVNLPLNATEGQVIGSIDLEETIITGNKKILPGLIERANGNILYADDANLVDTAILDTVMKAASGDDVHGEREGMSWSYDSNIKFIGTMNVSESPMGDRMLDLFDLCVRIGHTENEEDRYEIVRRRFAYDEDPSKFIDSYRNDDHEIKKTIENGKERIPFVSISDELIGVISQLASKLGIQGHRGDIALTNAAIAFAAMDGRDDVVLDDIKKAAAMSLGHRMTEIPEEPEQGSSEPGAEPPDNRGPEMSPPNDGGSSNNAEQEGDDRGKGDSDNETVFSVGNTFSVIDFTTLQPFREMKGSKGHGKHSRTRSNDSKGRYIRSRISDTSFSDLALDASMRAAAPYQSIRRGELALNLEPSDLRQKVREKKSGASVMFLVDASGSMGARKRMVTVKGAVFSLLQESYRNRDKVGLTAFRKDHAEVLLPFTKSVDLAYRKLKDLPTGGTTPLAAALLKTYMEVQRESRSKPNERYYVVVTTDGRANIAMDGGDAFKDALKVASHIGTDIGASWIVVDTGTGYPHTDNAIKICSALNGTYLKLEELNSDTLAHRIKTIVNNRGRA